ncbi:MAG: DUF29 family protein [Pseudanabaenaceae cyanobacterium]
MFAVIKPSLFSGTPTTYDCQLWLEETIAYLKAGNFHKLDLESLIEEFTVWQVGTDGSCAVPWLPFLENLPSP